MEKVCSSINFVLKKLSDYPFSFCLLMLEQNYWVSEHLQKETDLKNLMHGNKCSVEMKRETTSVYININLHLKKEKLSS